MAAALDPPARTLHAVRLLGFADDAVVAGRAGLQVDEAAELLLDAQALGLVTRSGFAGSEGWSLTDRGRVADERALAAELDAAGARELVADVHRRFLPVNARFQAAATRWQVRPAAGDPMAANDHTDHRWDDRVLDDLAACGRAMTALVTELAAALPRFDGYDVRYAQALRRALRGEHDWVDGVGRDTCHVVWMQLHEDLLATLGLDRADEH